MGPGPLGHQQASIVAVLPRRIDWGFTAQRAARRRFFTCMFLPVIRMHVAVEKEGDIADRILAALCRVRSDILARSLVKRREDGGVELDECVHACSERVGRWCKTHRSDDEWDGR